MELEFIGMLGVTEPINEKDLRALMEANFLAALHLTREVVKVFREDNSGSGSIGESLFRSAA